MDSSVSLENQIWFLRLCLHIPFSLYSSSCPCYVIPHWSIYLPQHSALEHTQSTFLPQCEWPSPIYQKIITLIVGLPISRDPGVLMKVSVQEQCALNNYIFDVAKLHYSTLKHQYHYYLHVKSHSKLSI